MSNSGQRFDDGEPTTLPRTSSSGLPASDSSDDDDEDDGGGLRTASEGVDDDDDTRGGGDAALGGRARCQSEGVVERVYSERTREMLQLSQAELVAMMKNDQEAQKAEIDRLAEELEDAREEDAFGRTASTVAACCGCCFGVRAAAPSPHPPSPPLCDLLQLTSALRFCSPPVPRLVLR